MNSSHKYFLDVFDPPALSRRVFVFSVAARCFAAELSFFRWQPPASSRSFRFFGGSPLLQQGEERFSAPKTLAIIGAL